MHNGRILVIDEDPLRESLANVLREEHYEVETAVDGYSGVKLFRTAGANLVIAALTMKEPDGIRVLEMLKKIRRDVPIIIITAGEELTEIIEAMYHGAFDFIEKPLDVHQLKQIVARALSLNTPLGGEHTKPDLPEESGNQVIVGNSNGIKEVLKMISQVSLRRTNLLIEGESGTGKELASRVIHNSGATREFPFVAVDINMLPKDQLEHVLFGYLEETPAGEISNRKGVFELAYEGTVFLDDISEMPLNMQIKLLRVLETREFEQIGRNGAVPIRARVIATTKRDLNKSVREGKFREDLLYRLSQSKIYIPSLRERREDIPALATHLLKRINRDLHKSVLKISDDVQTVLQSHEWSGNVAELESVLIRAVVLSESTVLRKEDLMLPEDGKRVPTVKQLDFSLSFVEKEHIKYVLDRTNGDKKEAARLLNISSEALYSKMREYNIVIL